MLETSRAAHASAEARPQAAPASDPTLARARWIVAELFAPAAERDFAVRYWDAWTEMPGAADAPRFTLVLRDPGVLRDVFLPPSELALGEAFVRGDIGVDGDIEAATGFVYGVAARIGERLRSPRRALRIARELLRLPRSRRAATDGRPARRVSGARHSRGRDAAAISHHYDVGNDFYALWLDRERVYSCGYFPTGEETIHEAQIAKLDLICRKLRLRPGERFLDIGCGWGALIRHAVKVYGAHALGITLSEQQAAYARQRIAEEGLGDRCRVELLDYRDVPRDLEFDKVASVGMFEHVGRAQLRRYFECAMRLTRPGGLFLNHGLTALGDARPRTLASRLVGKLWRRGAFADRYVFPDGELMPIGEVISVAESVGYEARDVEALREHYVRTLRHWVARLEAHADQAIALVGEATYRVWRLYMAGSGAHLAAGDMGLVQVLFARPDAEGHAQLPPTRADLYG